MTEQRMNKDWLDRTELLLGLEKLDILRKSHVLIVGLGGVGAWAAEMICRAGVGKLTLVDSDVVDPTNRNRQLPALISTTGKPKTEVLAERFRDINPDIEITLINEFMRDEKTTERLNKSGIDYVVDAIDTLSPKTFLISSCLSRGIRIVSSMGAGGKVDPSKVQIADISKSHHCNLARVLRKRLSRLGIKKGVTVVFSPEEVPGEAVIDEEGQNKKSTVGTISYMPAIFGCFVASEVIRVLYEKK